MAGFRDNFEAHQPSFYADAALEARMQVARAQIKGIGLSDEELIHAVHRVTDKTRIEEGRQVKYKVMPEPLGGEGNRVPSLMDLAEQILPAQRLAALKAKINQLERRRRN